MTRGPALAVLAALLLAGCMPHKRQPGGLAPPEQARSIPSAVDADRIAGARARAAVERGRAAAAALYYVAKADAWLDFATDAGRDEASHDTAEDALDQAEELIGRLERGRLPPLRTLHVVASRTVRSDLWELVDAMKQSAGFSCTGEPVARAEVALVWAGHKAFIGDQQRADEIGARAELLLNAARDELGRCTAAADRAPVAPTLDAPVLAWVPVPNPAPVSVPGLRAPATGRIEIVQLRSDALFPFGVARLDAASSEVLRGLAQHIRSIPNVVSVRIHGHTDRLSRSGPALKHRLAASRARAVRGVLVAYGVKAALIDARGHGDSMPVVDCPGPRNKATIDCLAPNRRVDIEIERAN